ncbi:hypothetical protein ACFOFO_18660 [Undibacterium arcticum]|uniref:Glutathione S-transferase n=1 Tax=Undibacterium arcticum TaxID=1762892 RepID=A0ABV7F894_9BURK
MMEAVRNTVSSLKGRALAGPHAYAQIPALAERSKARVASFMEELDARLQQTVYVAGPEFSAADITAMVAIDFAKGGIGMAIPPQQDAMRHWYDMIALRPASSA